MWARAMNVRGGQKSVVHAIAVFKLLNSVFLTNLYSSNVVAKTDVQSDNYL